MTLADEARCPSPIYYQLTLHGLPGCRSSVRIDIGCAALEVRLGGVLPRGRGYYGWRDAARDRVPDAQARRGLRRTAEASAEGWNRRTRRRLRLLLLIAGVPTESLRGGAKENPGRLAVRK